MTKKHSNKKNHKGGSGKGIASLFEGKTGYVPAEKGIVRQTNPDGTPNVQYADMLEIDREIAGQKYVCMSFVSPEHVLRRKELYVFSKFVEQWDMTKSMQKFQEFLGFLCHKYKLVHDDVMKDMKEFIEAEREALANYEEVKADFDTFIEHCGDDVEKKFDAENAFQTSVRGLKVRGVFSTEEEARFRAKMLREADSAFDVLVGPVGVWMPWEPEAYRMKNVEYLEEELNQLVHEKANNEEKAKTAFDQRVKDMKKKAMEENKAKALKNNLTLTQDLDENGELVGVHDVHGASTIEKSLIEKTGEVTLDDIEDVLFRGDNIVVPKGEGALPANVGVESASDIASV